MTPDDLRSAAGRMRLAAHLIDRLAENPARREDYLPRIRSTLDAAGSLLPADLRALLAEHL